MTRPRLLALMFALLLSGCIARLPPPQPSRSFDVGALVLDDTFDSADGWTRYRTDVFYADVVEGRFRLETTLRQYAYVLNDTIKAADVMIEAEFYPRADADEALYGVMCRGHENGMGYYFIVSADGSASIRRGGHRSMQALVSWEARAALNTGTSRQRLRAVCLGDYLAFYVNGEFVGEARDTLYRGGSPGLLLAVPPNAPQGTRLHIDVDSVTIREAQ